MGGEKWSQNTKKVRSEESTQNKFLHETWRKKGEGGKYSSFRGTWRAKADFTCFFPLRRIFLLESSSICTTESLQSETTRKADAQPLMLPGTMQKEPLS